MSEQRELLELPGNRHIFDSVKDDSSSLRVLRDSASIFSVNTQSTERSSMLSKIFPVLDEELMDTNVYQKAAASVFERAIRKGKQKLLTTPKGKEQSREESTVMALRNPPKPDSLPLSYFLDTAIFDSELVTLRSNTAQARNTIANMSQPKNFGGETKLTRLAKRVLITGCVGSGSDTVFLQLRLLDPIYYSADLRIVYRGQVLETAKNGIYRLWNTLQELEPDCLSDSYQRYMSILSSWLPHDMPLDLQTALAVRRLWKAYAYLAYTREWLWQDRLSHSSQA